MTNKYASMTDNQLRDAILAIRNRQNSTRSQATINRCNEGVREVRIEWERRHGKVSMFA